MSHRHQLRVASVVTALLASLAVLGGPAAAEEVRPGSLPRGADLARPYVEGTTIVDGSRVVDVPDARRLEILGEARTGWLVSKRRIVLDLAFVGRDGTERRLPGADEDVVFSSDGRLYSSAGLASDGETVVAVRRVGDGTRLAVHTFRSWVDKNIGRFAQPIDLDGDRMLIGGRGGRVIVWNWRRDTFRDVIGDKWHLQVGSLRHDVAAGWTAPGERCTFTAHLSTPHRRLWRSCEEQVLSLSPDGRRLVTIDRRLLPGFGRIRRIVMRTVEGRALGTWTAEAFTDIAWESDTAISFRVTSRTRTAMVRCSARRCQAATDPVPVPVTGRTG